MAALLLSTVQCGGAQAQSSRSLSPLRIDKLFPGKHLCRTGWPTIQFLGEEKLVALIGAQDCYRSRDSVELVVFTLDGHAIAQAQQSSAYPFATLPGDRIVTSDVGKIHVLDEGLKRIQELAVDGAQESSTFLSKQGPGTVIVHRPARRDAPAFSGNPLARFAEADESGNWPPEQSIATLANGDRIVFGLKTLKHLHNDGTSPAPIDISWLFDCSKLCQAWTGVSAESTSGGPAYRAVLVSQGSKVPLTDTGGLFPFCRILVIDLESGKDLFRKEFLTNTMRRLAAVSPSGRLLLLSDGDEVSFRSLP